MWRLDPGQGEVGTGPRRRSGAFEPDRPMGACRHGRATAQELEELAADAREGQKLGAVGGHRKLHLFNPQDGARLTL